MQLDKQFKMIQLLLQHTRAGGIDWKATGDGESISVSFDKASLLLTRLPSRESHDAYDYRVRVVGSDGEVVEEFKDLDFEDRTREAYLSMGELFELGRRKALGADDAIDAILEELEHKIPF